MFEEKQLSLYCDTSCYIKGFKLKSELFMKLCFLMICENTIYLYSDIFGKPTAN